VFERSGAEFALPPITPVPVTSAVAEINVPARRGRAKAMATPAISAPDHPVSPPLGSLPTMRSGTVRCKLSRTAPISAIPVRNPRPSPGSV
jgi:hypothetical protein